MSFSPLPRHRPGIRLRRGVPHRHARREPRLQPADLLPDLPPGTLLGVVLLIACTLVGKLGVGWYFLYPLPFHPGGTWPQWSIAALLLYLGVMGWAIGGVAAVIDSTVSVNF